MKKNKKILISVISITIVAIIAAVITIIILVNKKPSFNLNNYIKITTNGYDGYGTASARVDIKALLKDASDELDIVTEIQQLQFEFMIEEVINSEKELSKDKNLANGDKIILKWTINESQLETLEDKLDCHFEYENFDYNVTGLKAINEYDPFKNATMEFSGVDGSGEAIFTKPNDIPENIYLYYNLSETYNLNEGDIITVTIDNPEKYLENGVKLIQTQKEYTVEGLSQYITTLSQVSEEAKTELDNIAKKIVDEKVPENWGNAESYKGASLVGEILVNVNSWGNKYTSVAMVYEISAGNPTGDFTYYYYVLLPKPIINEKGNIDYDGYYTVPTGGSIISGYTYGDAFFRGEYYYQGFETLSALKDSLNQKFNISEDNLPQ